MHPFAWMILALQAAPAAPASPPAKPQAQPAAAKSTLEPLGKDEAARAGETAISFAELDEVLIGRRAMSAEGRQVIKHLLDTKLLARLAVESKLVITESDLDRRCKDVEADIVASGTAKSLREYLEDSGVAADVFRDTLKLAMIHETLARRALGTPEGETLNGEKQEMWLAQVREQRGAQFPPPPWPDGIVARCGDLEVKLPDLLRLLHAMLPPKDVREDCFQLLLLERIRARMPDLAPEALGKAVDSEIERRRREFESDPRYRGMKYEQAMGAQGLQASYLRQDPSVQIAALATLWVDRSQGDKGLRDTYTQERDYFDGRFGEAVDARMIFLNATTLPNQLLPRDFQAAERELAGLKSKIKTDEDFGKLARERSEEKITREKDGRIGYVTRGDERLPIEIREALFQAMQEREAKLKKLAEESKPAASPDAKTAKPAADGTAVVGPVRIQGGVCLLWAGLRRPAPGWEEMSGYVHRELRKRFMDELLTREGMRTYLDKP